MKRRKIEMAEVKEWIKNRKGSYSFGCCRYVKQVPDFLVVSFWLGLGSEGGKEGCMRVILGRNTWTLIYSRGWEVEPNGIRRHTSASIRTIRDLQLSTRIFPSKSIYLTYIHRGDIKFARYFTTHLLGHSTMIGIINWFVFFIGFFEKDLNPDRGLNSKRKTNFLFSWVAKKYQSFRQYQSVIIRIQSQLSWTRQRVQGINVFRWTGEGRKV